MEAGKRNGTQTDFFDLFPLCEASQICIPRIGRRRKRIPERERKDERIEMNTLAHKQVAVAFAYSSRTNFLYFTALLPGRQTLPRFE